MGFGREAARVRNVELPNDHRFGAMPACISLAQPIGYHATWTYLERRAGLTRETPENLTHALDLLVTERTAFLMEADAYGATRRAQKANGLRFPPRTHATPQSPRRWWGDVRFGALVTLEVGRTLIPTSAVNTSDERVAFVTRCIDEVLATGNLSANPQELQDVLDWARRQIYVIGWHSDQTAYRRAWQIQRNLGQIHLIIKAPTPLGGPWNFTD